MQPVTTTLAVSGMSCGHCVAAVKEALADVAGVADRTVAVGSATLAIDPAARPVEDTIADAISAIRDAGYDAAPRG